MAPEARLTWYSVEYTFTVSTERWFMAMLSPHACRSVIVNSKYCWTWTMHHRCTSALLLATLRDFQGRKQRIKEINLLAQGHTANKRQSQILMPAWAKPCCLFLLISTRHLVLCSVCSNLWKTPTTLRFLGEPLISILVLAPGKLTLQSLLTAWGLWRKVIGYWPCWCEPFEGPDRK